MLREVFERMTEHARQVVVVAQDEARQLKHGYTGPEHLLLGLLHPEGGLAAEVLGSLGITLVDTRRQVERTVGTGAEDSPEALPFTPRAKRILELSLREALSLKHNYIGSEHLLLAMIRETECVACRVLLAFNADLSTVRNEVIRRLPQASTRSYAQVTERAPEPTLDDAVVRARPDVSAEACHICADNAAADARIEPWSVARLQTGYVRLNPNQYFVGATFFLAKQCVHELHDLDQTTRLLHLQEMSEVAAAVFEAFQPRKLNYEALGNGTPHLHWWLTPRYGGDPRPTGPIWEDLEFLRAQWTAGARPDDRLRDQRRHQLLAALTQRDLVIERAIA